MSIILDNVAVPRQGPVELHINISINIQITADEAQRQVNRRDTPRLARAGLAGSAESWPRRHRRPDRSRC